MNINGHKEVGSDNSPWRSTAVNMNKAIQKKLDLSFFNHEKGKVYFQNPL
jgi:hypothetical protein